MTITLNDIIAGLIALGALAAVVYGSIVQGKAEYITALAGVLGLAAGWYFRGRVQAPTP